VSDSQANDVQATLQFFLEVDNLKEVERRNYLASGSRRENTAEHSWHLGIAAMIMAPFASEPIDLAAAMCMALVHDIVEIDAGDTFAYSQSEAELAGKEAREQAAADRLFGLLPPAQRDRFLARWTEFDDEATPEARFAHAVDRAMPALLNLAAGGQSWVENGVRHEQVVRRIGPPIEAGCPALWQYLAARLEEERAKGWFGIGA